MQTPYYLIDKSRLLANMEKVARLRELSGAKALLALKCFATWSVFDLMSEYMDGTTSSSLFEVKLGREKFPGETHAYSVAWADDEIDEVLGLRLGADDYIKKPFSQRLLIERIRALLRRADSLDDPRARKRDAMLVRGDLVLDPERHMCTWKSQGVQLTVTEFLLLQALAQYPGHVKSRDQLMDAAYGDHVYVDDRTIDSHIKRLRKKMRNADPDFSAIETLYGIGYRYNEE